MIPAPRGPGAEPSRSEVVYLLVKAEREQPAQAPDESWNNFYAREFVRHYQ